MKRFDGFTDILYKLFAINEAMYYLSRLPFENFLNGDAGTNVLRCVSLINRIAILSLVTAKCCGNLGIPDSRVKSILVVWVPFNYLWYLVIDAPFFMQEANEIAFILDMTLIVIGCFVSILLSSLMLELWVSRLLLITSYITTVTGFVIKSICDPAGPIGKLTELSMTDFDKYYFDALIFVACCIFGISVVLKFLVDTN